MLQQPTEWFGRYNREVRENNRFCLSFCTRCQLMPERLWQTALADHCNNNRLKNLPWLYWGLIWRQNYLYVPLSSGRGCCVPPKKGEGSVRFQHSARCASKWRLPNLREAGRTTGNPMLCYAGEQLGVAFSVHWGIRVAPEGSDQHQWQHRLFDKWNKLNLALFKFVQAHHTFFSWRRDMHSVVVTYMIWLIFFSHAFVDSEIAKVDGPQIFERMVIGSNACALLRSFCCFTFCDAAEPPTSAWSGPSPFWGAPRAVLRLGAYSPLFGGTQHPLALGSSEKFHLNSLYIEVVPYP